ncbi:hypothetical protein [Nocardia wallacei]|uniref:hypothetical protein n=1 Tax=Nocardia wallacei TaxID=480035 RepID=UPI0024539CC5|nr:hypothetical protein [Nocardia wallacei]
MAPAITMRLPTTERLGTDSRPEISRPDIGGPRVGTAFTGSSGLRCDSGVGGVGRIARGTHEFRRDLRCGLPHRRRASG